MYLKLITVKRKNRNKKELLIQFTDEETEGVEEDIVQILQSFPKILPAGYNKFSAPKNLYFDIINAFDFLDIELYGDVPKEVIAYVESRNRISESVDENNFKFKTEPFSFQVDCFEYAKEHDCFLLGDDQGLGKTKQAIDIAVSRKSNFKHCLVVCGVSGLKWNWAKEIDIHSNERSHILGSRISKNGNVVIDSVKKRADDLIAEHDEFFLITNIETLRDKVFSGYVQELCRQGVIGMTIVDEIHKCKNPTSQQGKALQKLNSFYKLGMTGTPLMNTPIDLFNILKWLGVEHHTYTQFKEYYVIKDQFGQVAGYKHLPKLRELVSANMLRRTKEEVLDLPEKTRVIDYVDLSSKQQKLYNDVRKKLQQEIDLIKLSKNPLAETIRLRQATGNPSILTTSKIPNAKFERANELIDEAVANGKNVVVFSCFSKVIAPFFEQLKHNGCIVTSDMVNKQLVIDDFMKDKNKKVICGTIGVLGTGFTLTKASVVIFLDSPWTRADKDQAEDRTHRIGAKENVTIYTLVAKNTIDEVVEDIVYHKGEIADYLVDGQLKSRYVSQVIDMLLK